jgi:hypothetical protein
MPTAATRFENTPATESGDALRLEEQEFRSGQRRADAARAKARDDAERRRLIAERYDDSFRRSETRFLRRSMTKRQQRTGRLFNRLAQARPV